MTAPFGEAPVHLVRAPRPRSGLADEAVVRHALAAVRNGGPAGLDLAEPLPTAAFSRRDRLLPGYDVAAAAVAAHGFSPMLRPVGGHLAVYGPGALVLHLWARHPDPRAGIQPRFEIFGAAVAGALRGLGVDARVGPVPGEYCDGRFSVNCGGRSKLAGTGQRIVKDGFLFSAVVMVHSTARVREALTEAYASLALDFDPATVGCVADSVPGVSVADAVEAIVPELAHVLPLVADRAGPATTCPARRGSRVPLG